MQAPDRVPDHLVDPILELRALAWDSTSVSGPATAPAVAATSPTHSDGQPAPSVVPDGPAS